MRLTAEWLTDPAAQKLCAALEDAGHQALFVGGCVRNALLGVPVSDIDLSTDAHPDRVTEVVTAAGFRAVPTGIDHGTVTVVTDHQPFEVTTFRRDVESHGRHATVAFSTSVEEDAWRRDFTMNALYSDARGTIIDPVGGLPDLRECHVRFVGEASDRVAEDYLRILRFFRFTAWYGDPMLGIDADGLAACADGADRLDHVSAERLGQEMKKLLSAPDPAPAVASMAISGVLRHVVPGATPEALAPLVSFEAETGSAPDPIRRLAALIPADSAAETMRHLRLSRAEGRDLERLTNAGRTGDNAATQGYRFGPQDGLSAVLIFHALSASPPPANAKAEVVRGARQTFPLTAADLMPALSGPALGQALKAAEARWIASGFALTKEELLA